MDVALAIIRHPASDAILIAHRAQDTHLGGLWEFPGGKCLPGEAPAACAVREALEETGLPVQIAEAWPPLTYVYPECTVTLHPFLCRVPTSEARPLASGDIVWVTPSRLHEYAFPPANEPLIARLRDNIPYDF